MNKVKNYQVRLIAENRNPWLSRKTATPLTQLWRTINSYHKVVRVDNQLFHITLLFKSINKSSDYQV